MNNLHALYTNGQDVLRIVKYVPPTPSIDGHFILARDDKGCEVTLSDFLRDWKVFNSDAAFADYLLYTDQLILDSKYPDPFIITQWIKRRCLEVGNTMATPINFNDLTVYFDG